MEDVPEPVRQGRLEASRQVMPTDTHDFRVIFGNGVFLTTAGKTPGAPVSSDTLHWTAMLNSQWVDFVDGRLIWGAASAGTGRGARR